jgi:hypothetical protein
MDRHSSSDLSAVGTNSGPAGSPRFHCPACSRSYKAVESLNRHRTVGCKIGFHPNALLEHFTPH